MYIYVYVYIHIYHWKPPSLSEVSMRRCTLAFLPVEVVNQALVIA